MRPNLFVPDPSNTDTVAEFIAAIRSLKAWAGNPSFEQLSRRSGLASSTLSDALSRKRTRLPRLEVVRGLVHACGGTPSDVALWVAAWRTLQIRQSQHVGVRVPHQIPRAVVPFIGRDAFLARLDLLARNGVGPAREAGDDARDEVGEALRGSDGGGARPSHGLYVLVGPAGVGKSAVAVHWAHRVARHYPDGQLYVDLRGIGTHEALAQLLQALCIALSELPHDLPSRVGLYRSLTYSRRLLVLLDHARDATQVGALLPSGPDGLAIITSRDRLSDLMARDGGHRLTVPPLDHDAAVALIAATVGWERAEREPAATAALAQTCGLLPQALRTAAVQLADHPDWTIDEFVGSAGRPEGVANGQSGSGGDDAGRPEAVGASR